MYRLLRGVVRVLTVYCLQPVWRALASYGALYVGPEAMRAVGNSGRPGRASKRLARIARGRFLVLPPGVGGPPPAHPERLCEDMPLSAQEKRLVKEVWPAYEGRGASRPRGQELS